jgi:hypothetical protein
MNADQGQTSRWARLKIQADDSVLTYKILSGCEAFRAETDRELLYKITQVQMWFPTAMFNHVSETCTLLIFSASNPASPY